MFGFGKSGGPVDKEVVDRLVNECRKELAKMSNMPPEEAARQGERLKEMLKDNRLPFDFRRDAAEHARRLECQANMRATDQALQWAAVAARAEKMSERAKYLAEARKYLSKAATLGCGKSFQRASQREIETIMLSGGVVRPGPNRAKPLSTAPRNPKRAKD